MIGQEAAAAAAAAVAVGSATIFTSSINNAITHQNSLAVALTVDSVAAIALSSSAAATTTAASTTTYYQQLGPIVRQ